MKRGGQMVDREEMMTKEGLQKLEDELEYLKTTRRREVADRIKQAREFGDISENSEYEDAKNEQALIEGSILTIEQKLRNAKIIDDSDVTIDIVSIGSTVHLQDMKTNREFAYTIVGSVEADPVNNLISNESPVGKALLGHFIGDVVEIAVPVGTLNWKIVSINK